MRLISYEFIHRWVWSLFSTSLITLYRILGSECYHAFTLSYFNNCFTLCKLFFIEYKTSLSCMLVQYQPGFRMFVILDFTEYNAYISYVFTQVWRHLSIFHIFTDRTIYHQFHSSIFVYPVLTTYVFVFIPNAG